MPANRPRTLYDKIRDRHVVLEGEGGQSLLYIDLHLIHEVTSPQAFDGLRRRGLEVRVPDRTLATADHVTPTRSLNIASAGTLAAKQLRSLERNCEEFGIRLFAMGHENRGIVHVIGPELGLTQPGQTIVCGDSHTSTHGAFGALAFGIGTTEVEHVLASQCLLERRMRNFRVECEGQLRPGVTSKDLILALISKIGVDGGAGHVIEYAGSAVRGLSMESRMTICNMSIEAGARAGLISPDDTTFEYMAGREFAPKGAEWDRALSRWRRLASDPGASWNKTVSLDVSGLEPFISFGTNPSMAIPIRSRIPDPAAIPDPVERAQVARALKYMDLGAGEPVIDQVIDVVFIGSCTNARIEDMREAARIFRGRKVGEGVRALVVPGSEQVRREAESEGLDRVFTEAGAEWRLPGCSMCLGMNGDHLAAGQRSVSTSNRNFEGRQGPGGRTMLGSPLTAAAAAVTGKVTDPRELLPA